MSLNNLDDGGTVSASIMGTVSTRNTVLENQIDLTNNLAKMNGGTSGFHRYHIDAGESYSNRQGNPITIKYFSIISDNSNITAEINPYKISNPVNTTLRTGGLTSVGGFSRVFFPVPDGIGYQMYICSTNIADTSAGTGARKIFVEYLDKDWIEGSTEVIMNGQTPVALTPTNIIRINRLQISEVGSDMTNRGSISVQSENNFSAGGVPLTHIINAIDAGYSFSSVSIRSVPINTRLYFTRGSFYTNSNSSQNIDNQQFSTFAFNPLSPNTNRITWCVGSLSSGNSVGYDTATSAPEFPTTDIEFTVQTDAGTVNANIFWNTLSITDTDNF